VIFPRPLLVQKTFPCQGDLDFFYPDLSSAYGGWGEIMLHKKNVCIKKLTKRLSFVTISN
jgi:hypothetical protein